MRMLRFIHSHRKFPAFRSASNNTKVFFLFRSSRDQTWNYPVIYLRECTFLAVARTKNEPDQCEAQATEACSCAESGEVAVVCKDYSL